MIKLIIFKQFKLIRLVVIIYYDIKAIVLEFKSNFLSISYLKCYKLYILDFIY